MNKRFVSWVFIGMCVAAANLYLLWIAHTTEATKLIIDLQDMCLIASSFAIACTFLVTIFSFVNDAKRKRGLMLDGVADFFSAEAYPCLTGLSTGFFIGMATFLFVTWVVF